MFKTNGCLHKTLEAAERLPMSDEPDTLEVFEEIERCVVDTPSSEQVLLECGRCFRQFDVRLVGGGALYFAGDQPCPRFLRELQAE